MGDLCTRCGSRVMKTKVERGRVASPPPPRARTRLGASRSRTERRIEPPPAEACAQNSEMRDVPDGADLVQRGFVAVSGPPTCQTRPREYRAGRGVRACGRDVNGSSVLV